MRQCYYQENSHRLLFTVFDSSKDRKADMYRIHHHTETELGFIVSGSGTYFLGDDRYDCTAGDLFLIPSGRQHCVPTVTSRTLDSLNLYLEPFFLWNVCAEFLEPERLYAILHPGECGIGRFREIPALMNVLKELQALFYQDRAENRFRICRTVLNLLAVLSEQIPVTGDSPRCGPDIAHLADIQNVVTFIDEHFSEPITLSDLACRSNLGRSRMSELFHEFNGISAYEYLLIRRIENAMVCLRETDEPILAVAQRCGFSNLSNFNRQFRRLTGLTPSLFRKYNVR